tara:strand:- start:3800 stop:4024 length:225 start_codon:yes stop_codon:yes gene_type:complete
LKIKKVGLKIKKTKKTLLLEFLQKTILDEDRNSPYTDEKLKILFEKQHKILVSRKTISKYRTKLNISKSLDRKI